MVGFSNFVRQYAIALAVMVIAGAMTVISSAPVQAETLTVYSGRSKSLVNPLIRQFTQETGIEVEVRYGSTGQMLAAVMEEGDRSPADVFWAQDAGALGALAADGKFITLPTALREGVPAQFSNDNGLWLATSARARVLAYSPERVSSEQLPTSIMELTDTKWAGRIGWAPTNASFQAFVTAMRRTIGEEQTRAWLIGVKNNGAKAYPKNTPIIQALAAGEIDLGLPNHYYLLRFKKSDSKYPVAQTFFAPGDIGNLVNVAGVGILKTSTHHETAQRFVEFLLSAKAQQYFTSDVFEYPVTTGVIPNSNLVDLDELLHNAPTVTLDEMDDVEGTQKLLREAGLI